MKTKYTWLVLLAFATLPSWAQQNGYKATIGENGRTEYSAIKLTSDFTPKTMEGSEEQMLEGFPLGHAANPTFKNRRGATLADIDGDGRNEIIFGANDSLFAYEGSGEMLWSRQITGFVVMPPSVADMDSDGEVEIALNTGGFPPILPPGRVYLMDHNGNDLAGWPLNFDDHWMINGPTLADIDLDGTLEVITSERFNTDTGKVHVLKMDGTELNENWPVIVPNTPGFTPSVGDLDGDGNPDILTGSSTNGGLYAFGADAALLNGFPQIPENASLSYQSPLLMYLDQDETLDIVGCRHGDNPEYYAVSGTGDYLEGWPVTSPGWTYSPPSAADVDGDGAYELFMGNPETAYDGEGNLIPAPMLYGFEGDGSSLPGFPIEKVGGNEGVIAIADLNDDGVAELIFTSNVIGADGYGFVHAYSVDGSGELDGFPLRPRGWTFLQSALLDDVNQDGNFDLTCLTYTATFGTGVDSIFVSAFDLGLPYVAENIQFNAYKGDNSRTGLMPAVVVGTSEHHAMPLKLFPNPTMGYAVLTLPHSVEAPVEISVFDAQGRRVLFTRRVPAKNGEMRIGVSSLHPGVYLVRANTENNLYVNKLIVK